VNDDPMSHNQGLAMSDYPQGRTRGSDGRALFRWHVYIDDSKRVISSADKPPIDMTILEPPMEWMGGTLLRLQVGVPTPAVDELQARLRLVMEAMIREMVGPGVQLSVAVGPAEES
jgi:hypothetical protein